MVNCKILDIIGRQMSFALPPAVIHHHSLIFRSGLVSCLQSPAASRRTRRDLLDSSSKYSVVIKSSRYAQHQMPTIGNKSVPIQLAQCRFPVGWPFSMLNYKYIFQIIYTEAILSNSTRKLLWFEITKMLIAI